LSLQAFSGFTHLILSATVLVQMETFLMSASGSLQSEATCLTQNQSVYPFGKESLFGSKSPVVVALVF
jgi:hypothetical protein